MPRVRGGTTAAQSDAFGDLRLERLRPAITGGLRARASEVHMNDRARLRLAQLRAQLPQRAIDPRSRRSLVIQVAFDPLRHPRRAERCKPFIEQPPGLAELRIGAIAQCQHRIPHALETRRIIRHQRCVEVDRALRRIALAPGAGDHQQVLRAGDLVRRRIGHVQHARGKPQLAGCLARRISQCLGIAGLGREQNGQRCAACRRCRRGRLRHGRRLIAREEPAQPVSLFGRAAGHDSVQRDNLVGRKRRCFRQHDVLPRVEARPATPQSADAGRQLGRSRSASAHGVECRQRQSPHPPAL